MADASTRIAFLDYLPEVFQPPDKKEEYFLGVFLEAFEQLFEGLLAEIEGNRDGSGGGIPDLFHPDTTPSAEFQFLPAEKLEYLRFLASWIALPLRAELLSRARETPAQYQQRRIQFNRQFFGKAIPVNPKRGTTEALKSLLLAWLSEELKEDGLEITDLTRSHLAVNAVFQLGVSSLVGLTTVLNEGPPFFFVVDAVLNPKLAELRHPEGVEFFVRATRQLLEAEKPFHTNYQLRAHISPIQLALPKETKIDNGTPDERPAFQLGVTSLLGGDTWDCGSQ